MSEVAMSGGRASLSHTDSTWEIRKWTGMAEKARQGHKLVLTSWDIRQTSTLKSGSSSRTESLMLSEQLIQTV